MEDDDDEEQPIGIAIHGTCHEFVFESDLIWGTVFEAFRRSPNSLTARQLTRRNNYRFELLINNFVRYNNFVHPFPDCLVRYICSFLHYHF
jgi:hypothetical protein